MERLIFMVNTERSNQEVVLSLLLHTFRVVNKYYNAYMYKHFNLSISQVAVLTVLYNNDGAMNPSAIASATFTERNNITVIIERMKKSGLVDTCRNSINKRHVDIVLTEKGKTLFERAKPVVDEIIQNLISGLTEDTAILARRPLRILRQNAIDGLSDVLGNADEE